MSDENQDDVKTEAAPETDAGGDEIAKLKEDLLRALAETENVRKRGERQAMDARTYAIERFAKDLLPVMDTLGRALAAAPADADNAALAALRDGVAMTERALEEVFARHGLKRVGAAGDKFDPNLHQAVAQIPSDHAAGAVAEVMQPGYVLADRTVRAAIVAVSLGNQAASSEASDGQAPLPGAGVDVTA